MQARKRVIPPLVERSIRGREHKVVCGECMAGHKPVGSGVFEATHVDAQVAANELRAHYARYHS